MSGNPEGAVNPLYRRIFLLVLLVVSLYIFVIIFPLISDLLVVLVISVILMYVFRPGVEAMERYGVSRTVSIMAQFILATCLIIFVFQVFVPILIREIGSLTANLEQVDFKGIYLKGANWLNDRVPGLTPLLGLDPDQAGILVERISATVSGFLQHSASLVAGAVNFLVLATMVPFLTFFFLKDGPEFTKKWIEKIPNRFFEMTLSLVHRIDEQLGAYIRSILLESLIIWAVTWPALAILGVKFALVLGLINGLMNAIPFLGPIIAYIPIGLVLLVTYSPAGWGLLWMFVILTGIQMLDNILLKPLIISRSVPVHPAVVLIAVLVGGRLAGAIGMFIAVPVFSIMQVFVIDFYEHMKSYHII